MRRHRHNLKPEQRETQRLPGTVSRARSDLSLQAVTLLSAAEKNTRTRKQCVRLVSRFLTAIDQLRHSGLAQLVTLGDTLHSSQQEIATMWRFTRNNGITEGFHTRMEALQRQAYGFRNFDNYRLRVTIMCPGIDGETAFPLITFAVGCGEGFEPSTFGL